MDISENRILAMVAQDKFSREGSVYRKFVL